LLLLTTGLLAAGNSFGLSDPTRPTDPARYFGTTKQQDSADLMLQSILFAADRRIAVINGTRVTEGDRIGSARVVRIQDSQVLLETGRGMRTLRLLPETLRR
jgi:MSHA biogenesis protein MshK